MRRILWCIISLCLILLSLALLLRFRDDAEPLPAPLENVVSHVEELLSLSPEHAVGGFKQDEEEEVQKEEGEEEDAKESNRTLNREKSSAARSRKATRRAKSLGTGWTQTSLPSCSRRPSRYMP